MCRYHSLVIWKLVVDEPNSGLSPWLEAAKLGFEPRSSESVLINLEACSFPRDVAGLAGTQSWLGGPGGSPLLVCPLHTDFQDYWGT